MPKMRKYPIKARLIASPKSSIKPLASTITSIFFPDKYKHIMISAGFLLVLTRSG